MKCFSEFEIQFIGVWEVSWSRKVKDRSLENVQVILILSPSAVVILSPSDDTTQEDDDHNASLLQVVLKKVYIVAAHPLVHYYARWVTLSSPYIEGF